MNRRKLIERTSRWFMLGGLIGASGFLAWRRQFGDPLNCFKNPFCTSCNQFSSCDVVAQLNHKTDERQKGK